MNMKKIMAIMTAYLIFGIPNVLALSQPCPVGGRVVGGYVGLEVIVSTDGATLSYTLDSSSNDYQVDFGGKITCYIGRTFTIYIKQFQSQTIRNVILTDVGIREDIDLTGIAPTCVTCPTVTCPTIPTCEEQGYIKPESCPTVPVVEDYTNEIVVAIISIIITLVATFKLGLKFYVKTTGEVAMQVKHKGIRGYHDANILHKDLRYRHRRYKDNPLGCLSDIKRINEQGSLV